MTAEGTLESAQPQKELKPKKLVIQKQRLFPALREAEVSLTSACLLYSQASI